MTKVKLKCTENGSIMVMVDDKTFTALCRCGGSKNKPYYDGMHTRIGFKTESKEIQIL